MKWEARLVPGLSLHEDLGQRIPSGTVAACSYAFGKLLVRNEKLEHTFLSLNHLAAAIIPLRKIELPINIVYG